MKEQCIVSQIPLHHFSPKPIPIPYTTAENGKEAFHRAFFFWQYNTPDKVIAAFVCIIRVVMLPSFRIMGKSAPALTRAFRATACRSAVVGSTADAKVTKDLGTAYPIGLPYSSLAHA